MSTFSENLHNLRTAAKIGAVPLAKELGIGKNSIIQYERGVEPTAGKLIKIADYFGVSIDYLVGHKPKKAFTDQERIFEAYCGMKAILIHTKQDIDDFEFERGKLKE